MKKIVPIFLTFFILVQSFFFCFYSTPVYGGLLDVDPDLLEDMANNPEKYEPVTMKLTEFLFRTITGGQALDKFFGTSSQELISNIKALFLKEGNCKTDGNNYYLTQDFVNEFNKATQDKVHALDGYYLFEPPNLNKRDVIPDARQKYLDYYYHDTNGDKEKRAFIKSTAFETSMSTLVDNNACAVFQGLYYQAGNDGPVGVYSSFDVYYIRKSCSGFDSANYMVIDPSSSNISIYNKENGINKSSDFYIWRIDFPSDSNNQLDSFNSNVRGSLGYFKASMAYCYGSPFRVFYSKEDLLNFWNKGRTYVPQLPSTTISIPIKYINNSVSLPDITYNINTTNKTEVEIQNEYNTTLNNYLNDLNKFSDGGSGINPTPTPSGGGSGDFGDGTTPTPKPDFGDGSDLTDTNDWLKKIYEWLQSFGDTHSKFEKTITDYIEANDGKLDQIIEAINTLSDGKTEDEKNGCKYDFTALSDFMTKLWNESDKKFDKMVELLEENNKYQKKLVNSLNEIKAILVTQTIMDVFQDRSQQTAEKAKDKFPTSLPWDIALVVNAMSAEPEKPQFNLPIQIKSLNINEEIHVDLASGEWEKLAKTCRYLLSILFILLMIQLSRKLFSNGGDD